MAGPFWRNGSARKSLRSLDGLVVEVEFPHQGAERDPAFVAQKPLGAPDDLDEAHAPASSPFPLLLSAAPLPRQAFRDRVDAKACQPGANLPALPSDAPRPPRDAVRRANSPKPLVRGR